MNETDPAAAVGAATAAHGEAHDVPHHLQTEDYGGGHVKARHGRINGWLLVVYTVLFVWAIYYGYVYWGGLGPGLDLTI